MYAKLYRQMYEGTLVAPGNWEVLVTFQQLLILADCEGVVDMTPDAISRVTTIPPMIITKGIAALEQSDPNSRTPDEDGRRIVRLSDTRPWGWRIVNHAKYRGIRTQDDRREYFRQYRRKQRAELKGEGQTPVHTCSHVDNGEQVEQFNESPIQKKYTDTEAQTNTRPSPVKSPFLAKEDAARFARWWSSYPRKVAKQAAIKAWVKLRVDDDLLETVLEAIDAQRTTESWTKENGNYIPYPATWLNGRRWEDDIASLPSLGQCVWNIHGTQEPGRPRCDRQATVDKGGGLFYCKAHADRGVR
jgi:hypothetical protein